MLLFTRAYNLYILGLSCYYHDAAACLVKDGIVIAAGEEERFNRQKHYSGLPVQAINFCLQEADITINDVDYVSFYEKPFLKFSRVIIDHLNSYPFSFKHFLGAMPLWLSDRLLLPVVLEKEIGYTGKVLFIKHHLAHAASSFLVSPFKEAAILTVDGVGEFATTTYGVGQGNSLSILKELHYPHSLGLLYTAVTTYLGFEANEGEGKVMGLAGYGQPLYMKEFEKIASVKTDGSIQLDMDYFGFIKSTRMYSKKFISLFGPQRIPETELTKRHFDIAASLQKFTEDILKKMIIHILKETKQTRLCLAGGVFLNCVANSKLLSITGANNIFIQPAAGDSGGALGSALYAYNCLLGQPRIFEMKSAFLGKSYSSEEIRKVIVNSKLPYQELPESDLTRVVAEKIAAGNIIGWFQGKMEIGPRALGNRSILADPRNPQMKDILNRKVKHREEFRPFAPAVLAEKAEDYFELQGQSSPFMLFAPEVRKNKTAVIPGVTHVDNTARVQTVKNTDNPRFYKLLKDFEILTGVPIIINTSFNLRGEPIVNTPQEAIACFLSTGLDYLVLENYILEK